MKKRGKVPDVWDVVSSLAQALTDARDQLVGLINSPGLYNKNNMNRRCHNNEALAMRLRGGGSCGKPHVPNNQKVRSVHRQHTRGHVAFGNHSEFKPEPPSNKPETMALNWSCSRPGSGNKAGSRGVQLYLDANSNSLQINSNKRGCESPVSIFIPKSSPCSPEYIQCGKECRPREPYDCKRHCIGTQYAALLREEACRARERRLAKNCERMCGKPRWARC